MNIKIKRKTIYIALSVILLFLSTFFTSVFQVYACNETELNSLYKKYGVNELLVKMGEITKQLENIASEASDFSKPIDHTIFDFFQNRYSSLEI